MDLALKVGLAGISLFFPTRDPVVIYDQSYWRDHHQEIIVLSLIVFPPLKRPRCKSGLQSRGIPHVNPDALGLIARTMIISGNNLGLGSSDFLG